jgi:hypothetical protein
MSTDKQRKKWLIILLHLLIWIGMFLFPYLQFPGQKVDPVQVFHRTWLPFLRFASIFYLNYFILTRNIPFRKKYILFFMTNVIFIGIFLWFGDQMRGYFFGGDFREMMAPNPHLPDSVRFPVPQGIMRNPPVNPFFIRELFSLIIPVIFSVAVSATENWVRSEAEKKEIENKNLESELQHLKYQLQPHFFFNSLNNIYSLVEISPVKAQEAIHNLSKLMRYLLYDTGNDSVELSEEIDFLKKYIQLMELRQSGKTITSASFPDNPPSICPIAPLLFIPLIENAFKHGVSATQSTMISFIMTLEDNKVLFISENSDFRKGTEDRSGSGIGLTNLQKRLDLIYPERHKLTFTETSKTFKVSLWIDMNGHR